MPIRPVSLQHTGRWTWWSTSLFIAGIGWLVLTRFILLPLLAEGLFAAAALIAFRALYLKRATSSRARWIRRAQVTGVASAWAILSFAALLFMRAHIHVIGFELSPLAAGEHVAGNVMFINYGGAAATLQKYFLVAVTGAVPPSVQLELEDTLFRSTVEIITENAPTHSLPPGRTGLTTDFGPILSAAQLEDIKAGRSTLYFVGMLVYRDYLGSRRTDYCWSSHGDPKARFLCRTHNEEPTWQTSARDTLSDLLRTMLRTVSRKRQAFSRLPKRNATFPPICGGRLA